MNLQSELIAILDMLVGLDIGGTKTAVLVVDRSLNVVSQFTTKTNVSKPTLFLDGVVSAIYCALEMAGLAPGNVEAIGVGLPGRVLQEKGEVSSAVNLNLGSFPVGEILSAKFAVPVVLENDVRAAAVGLYEQYIKQHDVKHMAYLSIGTGISAGVVINGVLHRGASGMAGEIGHVVFQPDGPLCACGAHGCLEALASGPALAQQWQAAVAGSGDKQLTAKDVFAAADSGDSSAARIIGQASRYIARSIQMLIMLYDVDRVVLGGGVSGAGASFLEPVLHALSKIRMESSLAQEMLPASKVTMLPAGSNAPTWGAVKLALQAVS